MRGKPGQWGNPFTKGNANAMRVRGLETRRWKSEKRLAMELCGGGSTAPVRRAQIAEPGPSLPSKPPGLDATKVNPTLEAKTANTPTASEPVLQTGEEIGYGYQMSPGGPWFDARPPVRNPHGLIEAAVLRAQRMKQRRWNGEPLYGRPR